MRTRVAIALLALGIAGVVQAQDAATTSSQDAEQRLQKVRSELKAVASERRKLEGARGDATRQLRQADEQVGSVQRGLRGIETSLQRDSAALLRLQAERAQYSGDLEARKAELARLLRAAQVAGDDAPLKAMLAQDRIAEAERALTYQGYLQRGRVQRIRELGAELQRIDALEREIGQRQASLASDRQQRAAQLAELEAARKQRAVVLAGIDRQYQDRAGREKALGRDAKALQGLLSQLRAAAAKAARDNARARSDAAKRPANGERSAASKRAAVATAPPLRVGGLGWPVSGNLLASFGGQLPDGRRSDGVLIAAAAGTAVKAVADGTVVFADWMTGYGNILIIDHGNGYMSLYAHNDGLLREAGDAVRRGDAVASVGTSGGQERPALYFELRRNGSPVNPGSWLTRQ
jgi:septal ring factor EnvC (AmiA/AmiB activator)